MASSIAIQQISPYRAYFAVSLDAGTPVSFQKSGAVAPNKDLSSLDRGPLYEYLFRLPNWNALITPLISKVLWRRITPSDIAIVPVSGGVSTVDASVIQNGLTSVAFLPSAGAGVLLLELVFLHSTSR